MVTATLLGLVFVPLFYVVIRHLFGHQADTAVAPFPTLPSAS